MPLRGSDRLFLWLGLDGPTFRRHLLAQPSLNFFASGGIDLGENHARPTVRTGPRDLGELSLAKIKSAFKINSIRKVCNIVTHARVKLAEFWRTTGLARSAEPMF